MTSLKSVVAGVLGISPSDLTDDSSPETIPSWDSFNGLMLVSELEKQFSVKFSMEEVVAVTKFKDIKDALTSHGVTFDE